MKGRARVTPAERRKKDRRLSFEERSFMCLGSGCGQVNGTELGAINNRGIGGGREVVVNWTAAAGALYFLCSNCAHGYHQ